MTTRRKFLAASALGTAMFSGFAGCLGRGDDDENGLGGEENGDTDDELLRSLADPSSQIQPKFITGYDYAIADLSDTVDPLEVLPDVQGSVSTRSIAETFETGFEGLSLSDVSRIVGSSYRAAGVLGGLDIQVPTGEGIHVTGSFDAPPIVDFFEAAEGYESIGEGSGFERFVRERGEIEEFRAFAVTEGRFVAVRRSDSAVDPADTLDLEFEQLEESTAPIKRSAPALGTVVESLDDGPIRVGAGYALIPLGANTGTAAFDGAIRGVVGSGVSATPGEETELHRAVTYLAEEMASPDALADAFEAAEGEAVGTSAWDFSRDGRTVTARATVESTPSVDTFRRALPVPGYGDLFVPINPADIGREAPPQLFFQPSLDDGILSIELVGGSTEEDLQVRYVHDGTVERERWAGPVQQGEQFQSANSLDSDTWIWVTWRPDTEDAAVLTRFETSA